jgi:PST family polysaccharide transporter
LVNILLFTFTIHWGVLAVAGAFLARAAVMYPVELFVLKRATGISPARMGWLLLPQLMAVLAMAACVYLLRGLLTGQPASLRLCLSVAAGVIAYGCGLTLVNLPLVRTLWTLRPAFAGRLAFR